MQISLCKFAPHQVKYPFLTWNTSSERVPIEIYVSRALGRYICIHTWSHFLRRVGSWRWSALSAREMQNDQKRNSNIPWLLKVLCDVKYCRTLHLVAATYYYKRRCEVQTHESNAQLQFGRPKQMVCQPDSTLSEPQPVLLDSDTIIIKFGIAVFERATKNIYVLNTCTAAKLIWPVSLAICLHVESNIFHAFGPDSRRKISDKFVYFSRALSNLFSETDNRELYVLICLRGSVACCRRHTQLLGYILCVIRFLSLP